MLASAGVFTFLLVLLLGLFGAGGGGPVPTATEVVQVRQGDTLWGLATRYAPDSDPRDVVGRIVELNDLDRSAVAVGEVLEIPVVGG